VSERRDRDRRDRERDRDMQEEENEHLAETERRGEQLREAWRQRHSEREWPKKEEPPAGGAA
jgi:hypothetical protein